MIFKRITMVSVAATLFAGTSFSADSPRWRDKFDMSRADLSSFTLTMIKEGHKAGFMTYGWSQRENQYTITDRTEMQPNLVETAKAVLDIRTLLPLSVSIDFSVGTNSMAAHLTWAGNQRSGQFQTVRNGETTVRNVDLREEEPVTPRMAVIGMIAALPLRYGFKMSLPWFNTLANRAESIALIVTGEEIVETPAGAFDAWRVAVKGGSPENVVYVTKAKPQRIVRIDVVGQPMHFVLAADKP